jgi:lysophospholipase L1-like esterase
VLTSVPTTLSRVVLVLASTITALLVGEGIARLAVHYPLTFPWADQINGVIAPRLSVRGRHFVPGTFDTTFSFSSQRFRGQQVYQPEPAPGAIRIAALGASFTFGSGANDNETYPSQLQSILQERSKQNHSNFAFEVINAGIAGSVTAEQALWYENWVRQFHPHVVILGVGCTVDHLTNLFSTDTSGKVTPLPTARLRSSGEEFLAIRTFINRVPVYAFLAQHSELLSLVRISFGELIRRRRMAGLANQSAFSHGLSAGDEVRDMALPLESGEVSWLKERVEQSGARFAVAVLPCRENIYPSQSRWSDRIRREYPQIVEVLRSLSSREGIPFTDIAPELRERAQRMREPLYYDRFDTHPTPVGYRAIAEIIASFLLEQQVVPSRFGTVSW